MESVIGVLSKFKNNLNNIINDYRFKIEEIEKEEEFIRTLGDLVNYSKNDFLLLPFYDMDILDVVFNRIFTFSSNEMNKVKTAKYLIEASKNVDKSQFLQYNNAVNDLEKINNQIIDYYNDLLSNNSLAIDKENYNSLINKYALIVNNIGDDCFNGLIDDVDLFHDIIMEANLSIDDINLILDVAIRDNLKYLDDTGIICTDDTDIINMKKMNSEMQEAINDLSNLLDASV